jgi:hypothetical protein
MLVASYCLGAATAMSMSLAFLNAGDQTVLLTIAFGLAGIYVAVKDSLEPAVAAEYTPVGSRSVAFGILESANSFGDFASSAIIGGIWTFVSPAAAFSVAGILMASAVVTLANIEQSSRTLMKDE